MRQPTAVLPSGPCPTPRQERVFSRLGVRHLAFAVLCWCLGSAAAAAQTPQAAPRLVSTYLNLPVEVVARPVPQPVLAEDGQRYLVYRLFVTNWVDVDLRLRSVEVLDGATGAVLATYDSTALSDP
ncbi:MAG TPA: hypothetical protein VGB66_14795, partial [Longimicrobium sp.]